MEANKNTEELTREVKLQHIEEILKARPDLTYQQIINNLREDGINVNPDQISTVKERMGIPKSPGGRKKRERQSTADKCPSGASKETNGVHPSPKPSKRLQVESGGSTGKVLIDLDHFALALEAAQHLGSWRELARLANAMADRLER